MNSTKKSVKNVSVVKKSIPNKEAFKEGAIIENFQDEIISVDTSTNVMTVKLGNDNKEVALIPMEAATGIYRSWTSLGVVVLEDNVITSAQRVWLNKQVRETLSTQIASSKKVLELLAGRTAVKALTNPRIYFSRVSLSLVDPKTKSKYSVNVIVV